MINSIKIKRINFLFVSGKGFFILLTIGFTFHTAYPQHVSDNWYFGVNAHVNFTQGYPVAMPTAPLNTTEGCSSASDSLGNILFYTNGVSVWNKYAQVMPNGSGLMGTVSSTQSALVVPMPSNDSLYYIFTVDETGGPNGFRYSIVNMNLQLGAGDVTVKNFSILNNVTEKLTAVGQQGTNNYWVAVHEWGSNAFYIYSLTSAGVTATPVISNAGIVHTNAQIQNTYGQMKFNPCGNRLAVAAGYLDTVEVFDFDPASGIISNPLTLPLGAHVYGVEFSPDGQKLYVSNYNPLGTLVQFDLTAGNAAAILASETVISTTADIYGLQLAIDGKVYVSKSFSQFLGVVDSPAVAGTGCNYIDNFLDLDPFFTAVTSALGLPGFVQSCFKGETICNPVSISENFKDTNKNYIYPNPSTGEFNLHFSTHNSPSEIDVIDNTGRIIEKLYPLTTVESFAFGKLLTSGIYFARIKGNLGMTILKLVKL